MPDTRPWRLLLLIQDGMGDVSELLPGGRTRPVFSLHRTIHYLVYCETAHCYVGFNNRIKDTGLGPTRFEVELVRITPGGNVFETTLVPIGDRDEMRDCVFSPRSDYALFLTNMQNTPISPEKWGVTRLRSLYDLGRVDLLSGETRILARARVESLGEIHPDGERVLYTDLKGNICVLSLKDLQEQVITKGEYPYWNSDGTGIRFVKAFSFGKQKGADTWGCSEGNPYKEFELNLKTGEEKKILRSPADHVRLWSPDRKTLIRLYYYDKFFRPCLARITIENADGTNRRTLAKDILEPGGMLWVKSPEPTLTPAP